MGSKSRTITAGDQFSAPLFLKGDFNVSIRGTFVAEVVVQRSFDRGASWGDVSSYLVPIETRGYEPEGALYRMGVKPGKFTSGTITARIGQ